MNAVQEKDVQGQIEGHEVETKTEPELSFADVATVKDLDSVFAEHPEIVREFDWMGDPKAVEKFKEKYGKPKAAEGKEGTDGATPSAEAVAEEDWMAEEGAKETPVAEKPVESAVKHENDQKIQELSDQLQNAMKEIDGLKQKGTTPKETQNLDAEIQKIESGLSGLDLEGVDMYTEEGQEKVKKHIKVLGDTLKDAVKMISTYGKQIGEIDRVKQDVGAIKTEAEERKQSKSKDDQVASEFSAIDAMVKDNKDIFGEKSIRPIKAIEDDYVTSVKDMLEKVARVQAPLYDENGNWSKEALRVIELSKGTSDKAKRFQAKCKEVGIGLPEDIDVLETVYEIRRIQRDLSLKDDAGNIIKAADYGTAAENYLGRNIGKIRAKDRVENRTAHDRAVANRKSFAPETHPGAAPEDEDITKLPRTEVDRIMKAMPKTLTPKERELKYKILVHLGESEADAKYASMLDENKE